VRCNRRRSFITLWKVFGSFEIWLVFVMKVQNLCISYCIFSCNTYPFNVRASQQRPKSVPGETLATFAWLFCGGISSTLEAAVGCA